jgi:hypothetical protein
VIEELDFSFITPSPEQGVCPHLAAIFGMPIWHPSNEGEVTWTPFWQPNLSQRVHIVASFGNLNSMTLGQS